jgi:hypothetical protein
MSVIFACDCGWRGREPRIVQSQETVEFWGATETRVLHECECPACGEGVEEITTCRGCDADPRSGDDYCADCDPKAGELESSGGHKNTLMTSESHS